MNHKLQIFYRSNSPFLYHKTWGKIAAQLEKAFSFLLSLRAQSRIHSKSRTVQKTLKKPYHPALSLGFIFTWCLINVPNHTISLQMQPIMTGVKRSPMAVWRRQQLLKLPPAHPEPPFLGPSSPQFLTFSHQRKMVMVVSYFNSWGIVI